MHATNVPAGYSGSKPHFRKLCHGVALLALCLQTKAQVLSGVSNVTVSASAYVEVSRGPHSRVMRRTTTFTNLAGTVITRTNSFVEIGSGLSVLSNGVYVAANPQIQITGTGAQCTNCQHKVTFAADFLDDVDLTTPEGWHMTSHIAALAYFDGTTNVIIATPQSSIGQVLSSGNEVLYTNAFTNASCDVSYIQTRSSLEQNVIIRAPLPPPIGLSGTNIWLQVWSEWTAAPTPTVSPDPITGGQFLDFGAMKMALGKAFLIGGASNSVPVAKQWVSSGGRTFLIESVPLSAIQSQLNQLPGGGESKLHLGQPMLASHLPPPKQEFSHIKLPERKFARKSSATMRIADATVVPKGLAIDFIAVNGSMTNVTFYADETYEVVDDTELYGDTVIEGDCVIKNGTAPNAAFAVNEGFICTASPYRPVIFTSTNDDSVGASLDGGSGTPSVAQGTTYLYFPNGGPPISNIHFRYGWNPVVSLSPDVEVSDCQFIDCMNAVTVLDGTTNVGLHNILIQMEDAIDNTDNYCSGIPGGILFNTGSPVNLYCEHLTANTGTNNYMSVVPYYDTSSYGVSLTNSIIVAPSLNPPYMDGTSTSITATTNSVFYASTLPDGLFQTVGAGSYYLADDTYRNAGTNGINAGLLADLRRKTTHPPLWLTNAITNDTVINPQVARDTNSNPDLGYHYESIDYLDACTVSNATLTITNGVVLAYYNNVGVELLDGSQLISQGSATNRNYCIFYRLVQEQPTNLWSAEGSDALHSSMPINFAATSDDLPSATLHFTTFVMPAGEGDCFSSGSAGVNNFIMRDCEIYQNDSVWEIYPGGTYALTNNLFVNFGGFLTGLSDQLIMVNNSFVSHTNAYLPIQGASVFNNAFDVPQGVEYADLVAAGENGFMNGTPFYGSYGHSNDVIDDVVWQTGPLGKLLSAHQ